MMHPSDEAASQAHRSSPTNDLWVDAISDSLSGKRLDVIVSGSIGAIESIRFIRSLRRLGASVTAWLTTGGAQFVTPTALAWASDSEVRTDFSGHKSHIGVGDALVIAPLSASLAAKIAHGVTDSPASALAASYLGQARPVIALPNMHQSLANSPATKRNLDTLVNDGTLLVPPRLEEGKLKFPAPEWVADHVSYLINKSSIKFPPVAIAMGTTRGYIDDVRYISNYSSGKLGSLIGEELYRLGIGTMVVKGPCLFSPKTYSSLTTVETNAEMTSAIQNALAQGAKALVMAASVLDFAPKRVATGKIKSADHDSIEVHMEKQPKILSTFKVEGPIVGFKLEVGLSKEEASRLANDYFMRYGLNMFVANDLNQVSPTAHAALVFTRPKSGQLECLEVHGKAKLASVIAKFLQSELT